MSAIVDISTSHYTANGARYAVEIDGFPLIKSSRDPEHEAARKLMSMGVTGRLQWRWKGTSTIAGQGLIAVLATETVTEGQNNTPRVARWSEHWSALEAAE